MLGREFQGHMVVQWKNSHENKWSFHDYIICCWMVNNREIYVFRYLPISNRETNGAEGYNIIFEKSYQYFWTFNNHGKVNSHSFENSFEDDVGRASDIDQHLCYVKILYRQLDEEKIIVELINVNSFLFLNEILSI